MASIDAETRRSRNVCVIYMHGVLHKKFNKIYVISITIITQIARFTTAGTNQPPIFIKNELCALFRRSV